jgi:LPXTG-motif cell wall-anchored protein
MRVRARFSLRATGRFFALVGLLLLPGVVVASSAAAIAAPKDPFAAVAVAHAAPAPHATPAAGATTVVHVGSGFTFNPSAVTIHVGDTVTWQHDSSSTMHSVTADDGSFDSSPNCPPTCLGANSSFSHTFNTAGTFRYYCKIHGGPGGAGMSGTVTVLAATPTTTTPGGSTTVPQAGGAAPTSSAPGGTAAPAAAPSASLPRTGSSSVPLLLAGAAAILLGIALLGSRRRTRRTT